MINQSEWNNMHSQKRFRPQYPEDDVVRWLFSNFADGSDYRILDDGCGAGRHVMLLADNGFEPYGIDYSANGVEYTRELLAHNGYKHYAGNIQKCSCESLPFESSFFDGVICFGVLCYLSAEGIKRAVDEIYRVLKYDGKAVIVLRNTDDYRYKGEDKTIAIDNNTLSGFQENGMQEHFVTREEIVNLFRSFSSVDIERIIRTHENEKICDNDYIVFVLK